MNRVQNLTIAAWLVLFAALAFPHHISALPHQNILQTQSDSAAASVPAAPNERHVTAYTLPPDLYRKAHLLNQISFWGQLVGFFYSVAVLLLILRWNWAARFRDWAESISKSRLVQALIFLPPILAAIAILGIPLDIAQEWVSRKFGLSIQSWPSWLWDWTKGQLVGIVIGIILIWILYAVIRKSPSAGGFISGWSLCRSRSILIFLQPLVIDPLFHKFAPLAQKDPALTAQLEQMVQRAGQNIPPERMFWMDASEKIHRAERVRHRPRRFQAHRRLGHHHRQNDHAANRLRRRPRNGALRSRPHLEGNGFAAPVLFVLFYLGFRIDRLVCSPAGAALGNPRPRRLGFASALLLLLTVFHFLANPISNAFSRHFEHQADQYGLEVTHGLTPNSPDSPRNPFRFSARRICPIPIRIPLDVFLFYDHPPISDRVRFVSPTIRGQTAGTGEFCSRKDSRKSLAAVASLAARMQRHANSVSRPKRHQRLGNHGMPGHQPEAKSSARAPRSRWPLPAARIPGRCSAADHRQTEKTRPPATGPQALRASARDETDPVLRSSAHRGASPTATSAPSCPRGNSYPPIAKGSMDVARHDVRRRIKPQDLVHHRLQIRQAAAIRRFRRTPAQHVAQFLVQPLRRLGIFAQQIPCPRQHLRRGLVAGEESVIASSRSCFGVIWLPSSSIAPMSIESRSSC